MRVLIADDHEVVRDATRRILQARSDIECFEANNGAGAIQQALAFKPDLIILDISLPDISGFDAAREIKEHLPGVPILFFSIYDSGEHWETAKAIGEGMVLKTDAVALLLKAVDALMQEQTFFPNTGSPE